MRSRDCLITPDVVQLVTIVQIHVSLCSPDDETLLHPSFRQVWFFGYYSCFCPLNIMVRLHYVYCYAVVTVLILDSPLVFRYSNFECATSFPYVCCTTFTGYTVNNTTRVVWIFSAFYSNQSVSDCRFCSVYSSDVQMSKAFFDFLTETLNIGYVQCFWFLSFFLTVFFT